MKKFFIVTGIAAAIVSFSNCGPSKKATSSTQEPAKTTYTSGVSTLVMTHCSPCHIPAKGGNKKAYDTYAAVKTDIDEIIRRIQLNPGDRGFMPFKHPKLPDSTIAVFTKWKAEGMLEN